MSLYVSILPALAAVLTGILALYAWTRKDVAGAKAFSLLEVCIFIWTFFTIFELLSSSVVPRLVFITFEYIGICFAPYFALSFALHYTHRDAWWQRWKRYLLILPASSLLVAVSNAWHGFMFHSVRLETTPTLYLDLEHGWWFNLVLIPYNYVYFLAALAVLVMGAFGEGKRYRSHVTYLALSFVFPFIGNVLFVVLGITFQGLDPTPILFSVSALLLTFSLFRTGFMQVAPLSYATVFAALDQGVILLSCDHKIIDINEAALSALGKARHDVIDKNALKVLVPYRDLLIDYDLGQAHCSHVQHEFPKARAEDVKLRPVYNPQGQVVGRALITRDVTLELKYRTELEQLAFQDSLTGLANRHAFMQEARERLAKAEQGNGSFALLYLDLNGFKQINDTLGHAVGDRVLHFIAQLLRRELRDNDLAARLGGDEFVALLPGADYSVAEKVGQRLQTAVARPFAIGEQNLKLTTSIGLALYPSDGLNLEELLSRADSHMYARKRALR